ncbi:hypothetical protein GLAREA_07980 [Glarea lozoyensis ATCC 20868]|uniref:Uncharacterized protein n=1 Tax=Glarea lozoyensis (strain ATCC 20868 / MF5171) TaxID=1116229 RepID=S3CDN9_GLAL2|nr:uncharacterized protein GLAREA_07980 [Glarea lozoyensis ATCC 20868]EPE24130.1 hypothetical protein GLAREA_07980 [Glarea lozoyensis ATCC 20868]
MKCIRSHDAFIHKFLLTVLLCFCLPGVRGERKCYYPNNTLAPSDSECSAGAETSVCCGKGYVCLGNGVCQIDPKITGPNARFAGTIWRGSCTDQTWNSPECPKYCAGSVESEGGNTSSGQQLGKCPGVEDTYYCKTAGVDFDCSDSSKVFQIKGEDIAVTTLSLVVPTPSTTTLTTSTSAVPTDTDDSTILTTLVTTLLPAPTIWTMTTSTVLPTPSLGNTATSSTTSPTSVAPITASSSYASRNAVAIGVGVGASIGAVALGILAFFLIHRHRQKSKDLIEVYQGPWPPVNSVLYHNDSSTDLYQIHSLPRGRSVSRSHLESLNSPIEPMFLPPIVSPLPLSPIFTPLEPVERVGQAF